MRFYKDMVQMLSVFGEVDLDSNLSYTQNIDRLFFKKKGDLWDEFDVLYSTLFSNNESYINYQSL